MIVLLAPFSAASTWPPDTLLNFGGRFSWADGDGDGVDDPWLGYWSRGVVLTWPSSQTSAEPRLWSAPGACGYTEIDVERPSAPGQPIRIAVASLRKETFWLEEFTLLPGADEPVFQWQAPVGRLAPSPRYVGDVDGDGTSDLFVFTEYGPPMSAAVRLSRTGVQQILPVALHSWDTDPVHRVDDLDGDGFADLVVLTPVQRKPGSLWGSLVHSVLVLRGSPDGFLPEPLWEIGYREQPGGVDWDSPGVGVVRLQSAMGEPRLALTWTHHSGYESSIEFREIDLLGDVGTATPTVLQTVAPSGWYISSYWDLGMARLDASTGTSVVIGTESMAAWFSWDPVADRLGTEPFASDGYVDAWGMFGADPGPFGATYAAVYGAYGLWGWTPPQGITPTAPTSDDPRLVDCLPPPSTGPSDTGGSAPTELPPTDPPGGDPTAPNECGCGTGASSGSLWLGVVVGGLGWRRAGRAVGRTTC